MSALILAAGGIVSRPGSDVPELVVIHRPRHADWSFPKGKVDPGETLTQTALREVWEETALRCRLGAPLGAERYPGKEAHYWAMTVAEEGAFVPNDEVDQLRWVPVTAVARILTHGQDRAVLGRFLALGRPGTTTAPEG